MDLRQRIVVKILLAICRLLTSKFADSSIHPELTIINELVDSLKKDVEQIVDNK